MDNNPKLERYHELMESSHAAFDEGDPAKALDLARKAYTTCPDSYPANYNSLAMTLKCLRALGFSEEAEVIQKTMEKLLWEHDTKPHAEGEARAKHTLKKEKGL